MPNRTGKRLSPITFILSFIGYPSYLVLLGTINILLNLLFLSRAAAKLTTTLFLRLLHTIRPLSPLLAQSLLAIARFTGHTFTLILRNIFQSLTSTKPLITSLTNDLFHLFSFLGAQLFHAFSSVKLFGHRLYAPIKKRLFHSHSTTDYRAKKFTLKKRYLILAIFLILTTASYLFYQFIIKDLPDPRELATNRPEVTTKIYDRHHRLLYKIYKNQNRSIIPLKDIPQVLQQATIAIEDQNFYAHSGFSIKGIARAFKSNLSDNSLQGGSTITQQLIKNTLLSPERTFSRKIKELLLSVLTEFFFTKDEILEMYFNQVPYGGTAYGVEEASQMYFGKPVASLDLAEASFLAGLPAAPTKFSPYGTRPELAVARQHQVLRRLVEDGYITLEQADHARNQKISILPQTSTILAPHFVMYIKDMLVDKYGLAMVEHGGLEVVTTLDMDTQTLTEQIVTKEVETLKNLRVNNGAALVTNPQTGEILAMVGSKNYFDAQNDGQVNITIRERQPGSSIKPINYATALESGFTPATIIPDSPICFHLPGQKPYCPKNYDNKFHGNVTLRTALANSYNIPAVKTLSQIGVENMINKAQDMGITTWENRSRFGLSLTLGGGEVTMVDMATAYGVFANQGMRVNLNPILSISDYTGKILETHPCATTDTHTPDACPKTRALDPRVAFQISDILSDNNARARAFGYNSVLNIKNHQVAVKTGTTNNLRDNWTIGYTSNLLVATWVGNNDNTSMSYIASGITGASPIWSKIITYLIKDQPPHTFAPSTNLSKVSICTLTGTLPCGGCPSKDEYFLTGTEPKNHCTTDQINAILNKNKEEDPEFRDRLLEGTNTN